MSTGRPWKSEPREPAGRISQSQRVESKVHGLGCQNGPKNLQDPPNPTFFVYFFGSNERRQKNGLPKCKATNPFFGETMVKRWTTRRGCVARERDVRIDRRTSKGPQFPNPLFCFGRQSGGRRSTVLFW